MSSEVQLTDEKLNEIVSRLEAIGAASPKNCVRAGEQAVRAQWAAEVHNVKYSERQRVDDFVAQLIAERDSAQAEAKALRSALVAALEFIEYYSRHWNGISAKHPNTIATNARAALQPGAHHDE